MTCSNHSRAARRGAGVLLALSTLTLGATPAHAADAIKHYRAVGSVAPDGTLNVSATITPEAPSDQLVQRFATVTPVGRDRESHTTLTDVTASVGGVAVTPKVTTERGTTIVSVPTDGKNGDVQLGYKVVGAARDNGDGTTTLDWRLVQGLSATVGTFDASVKAPRFTEIDCYAGPSAAPGVCGYFGGGTHEEPDPVFHEESVAPGEVVGVSLRFPASAVKPNADLRRVWTLDGAFSTAPLPLALAALAALLGGALGWLLHRRHGQDAHAPAPLALGSFKPVGPGESEFTLSGDLRPAEVGTLADERVDPIDVTAAVLDLAVRNHLLITQLPRSSEFGPTDWALSRREASAALLPYEKTILDAVAPADGSARSLKQAGPELIAALPTIQSQLYDEVVTRGWFNARPDATRGRWSKLGWLALIVAALVAVLLIMFTPFGLLGLVLVALAGAVGWLGQAMPARTSQGAGALAGLDVLRGVLLTQPTDQMPQGREHAELSAVLPYAVVLGGADRWLDGIALVNDEQADDATELGWYHGPAGWTLQDLPDSLRNFIRAFQGTLVTRQ